MLLLRWILNTLILILVANVIPGISFTSLWAALITSIILGLINTLVRPIIILLTLPINIVTLGLFTFIINGLMFWLASTIVRGFEISGFLPAFFGALLYWLLIMGVNYLIKD